jgi:hypothetical protein
MPHHVNDGFTAILTVGQKSALSIDSNSKRHPNQAQQERCGKWNDGDEQSALERHECRIRDAEKSRSELTFY